MGITSTADATWSGNLAEGAGSIDYVGSGAFSRMPVTWAARTEAHNGKTSPEELLAAAHAACYSMALSGALGRNSTPAAKLSVNVAVTFDKTDAGWGIASSVITVRGEVPGIDQAKFAELAETAKDGCPVSRALKGNVALSVTATLA
jgi:osmotically inducible protein OsmC